MLFRSKQSGIIHKIVDIPFTMFADVSASNGLLRIHPTKLDICGINGLGLLKAVNMTMQKMLKLPKERGISAEGNDLLLDPNLALPPPKVEQHFGITRGHIHHVDNSFGFSDRLPYATPVQGLYAAGAGCHPAGSVIGAAGHNAAKRLLRDLGRER